MDNKSKFLKGIKKLKEFKKIGFLLLRIGYIFTLKLKSALYPSLNSLTIYLGYVEKISFPN